MDCIFISDLLIFANHGVFEEEKKLGQKFYVDIRLGLNTQDAGLTKDLSRSVHYGEVSDQVVALFRSESEDLIETCAEKVAQFILQKYPLVQEVLVRVKKPWAPVRLPVDTVYVEIRRKRHRAFLGLGSNMGESRKLLKQAMEQIENEYIKIVARSDFFTTKAWGLEDQPDFLNNVIEIETSYEPSGLLSHLQRIELALGRERKIHWGPRTVDIDILFFDDKKIYQSDLIIPHPYVEERAFVLEPMNQIAPHFIHPVRNKPIRRLLEELRQKESAK